MSFKTFIAPLIICLIYLISCSSEVDKTKEVSETVEEHNDMELHLDPHQMQNLDLEIAPISTGNISAGIHVTGQLEVPPQNKAYLSPLYDASIQKVFIIEGQKVKTGQKLFSYTTPEIVDIQESYLQIKQDLIQARAELERLNHLNKSGLVNKVDLTTAQSTLAKFETKAQALASKLKQLNVSKSLIEKEGIQTNIDFIAPIDGYVAEVNISIGQHIQKGETAVLIINNHHVHADLLIYERDAFKAQEGQKVNLYLPAKPNHTIEATVIAVGKTVEEANMAVRVHAELTEEHENHHTFIGGLYVEGDIITENINGLVISRDAVVRYKNQNYIFRYKGVNDEGEEHFEFVKVEIKDVDQNNVAILNSIDSNANYVHKNAYSLIAVVDGGSGHSH